jgi:hypothetical protein
MTAWVAIGFAAFLVSSLVIGIRLLALWWGTRRLPELLIAFGILGVGPVGFAFVLLGQWTHEALPALSRTALGASLLANMGGTFATAVFNWHVYRPHQSRLRLLVMALGALLVAALLWEAHLTGFVELMATSGGYRVSSLATTVVMLWGSGESLNYYAMMRRRTRLGLADPMVTNRFLLWGLGIGAAGIGCVISVSAQLATGQHMMQIPWVTASNSLHGFTAALLMWVAFLPPAFYRRFIESRASQAGAS